MTFPVNVRLLEMDLELADPVTWLNEYGFLLIGFSDPIYYNQWQTICRSLLRSGEHLRSTTENYSKPTLTTLMLVLVNSVYCFSYRLILLPFCGALILGQAVCVPGDRQTYIYSRYFIWQISFVTFCRLPYQNEFAHSRNPWHAGGIDEGSNDW